MPFEDDSLTCSVQGQQFRNRGISGIPLPDKRIIPRIKTALVFALYHWPVVIVRGGACSVKRQVQISSTAGTSGGNRTTGTM